MLNFVPLGLRLGNVIKVCCYYEFIIIVDVCKLLNAISQRNKTRRFDIFLYKPIWNDETCIEQLKDFKT